MIYVGTLSASRSVGLSQDRIRLLCVQGRIPGAIKFGKAWLLPKHFKIIRNGSRGPKSSITGNKSEPIP